MCSGVERGRFARCPSWHHATCGPRYFCTTSLTATTRTTAGAHKPLAAQIDILPASHNRTVCATCINLVGVVEGPSVASETKSGPKSSPSQSAGTCLCFECCIQFQSAGFHSRSSRLVCRYVKSRSDPQIQGSSPAYLDGCLPQEFEGGDSGRNANPCGLVAWSLFNDTFAVRAPTQVSDRMRQTQHTGGT